MTSVRRALPRRLLVAAIALGVLIGLSAPAAAEPATPAPSTPAPTNTTPTSPPPATQAPDAYIVVDAETGRVLLAKDEHAPHLTASTIKVFTALVALERRSLNAPITVSALAAAQPASKIDMQAGSTWTMDQAIHSLLIISANDAAYAIAESTGGDLAGFAKVAAATAKRLGMKDTTFQDPAGLDGAEGYGGGTRSSAYDLAIVGRNALTIPAIADTAALPTYEFTDPSGAGRRLVNHNRGFLTTYPGAIGLKTGYTSQAGRTLITAARRDGRTLVAVVLNTWDDTGWSGYLLDQAFAGTTSAGPVTTLPPARAVTFDDRMAGFATLPEAFRTALDAVTTATGLSTVAAAPTAAPQPSTTTATASPAADAVAAPVAAAPAPTPVVTASDAGGWTFGSVARVAGIVLGVLLVVLVALRRRAVKRQRARRRELLRAHREARRRGMIDIIEPDDADVRVVPGTTSHHVSAARRYPNERRVQRAARPRRDSEPHRDRNR